MEKNPNIYKESPRISLIEFTYDLLKSNGRAMLVTRETLAPSPCRGLTPRALNGKAAVFFLLCAPRHTQRLRSVPPRASGIDPPIVRDIWRVKWLGGEQESLSSSLPPTIHCSPGPSLFLFLVFSHSNIYCMLANKFSHPPSSP
jgi:hypothetical protein